MSFTKKKINVQFTLANGSFGSGKNNTATITGLRVLANIVVTGGETQATAELAIYGLPLDMMNQLSVVGTQISASYKNSITVEAGDDESGMHLVFAGNIINAFVDANNMPQVCFRVSAAPGMYYAMKPVPPLSIKGSADAAGMMQKIAGQMGLGFENAGVTAKLANPYFGGTLLTQAKAIARHAGFDMFIDKNTMAIVPPKKSRSGGAVLVSPETGMVGYPQFNQAAIIVTALYSPEYKIGGEIKVESALTAANATWKIFYMEHHLESEVPKGQWFTVMKGTSPSGAISGG